MQWVHQLGSTAFDATYGVAADGNGNVYITGWTMGTLPVSLKPTVEAADAFVAKYSSGGFVQWVHQMLGMHRLA